MKKLFFYSLALGMMTLGLTSCNDDEDQLSDTRVTHFAELELLGDTWIEMNVGDTFKDPGYKATEGTEDITSKVVVSGSVNTAVGAFYNLVYSVSNKDGFAVSAEASGAASLTGLKAFLTAGLCDASLVSILLSVLNAFFIALF